MTTSEGTFCPTVARGPYAIRSWTIGRLRVTSLTGWPFLEFKIEGESNLVRHARRELALLRGDEPCELQDAIERNVLAMMREFSKAGHSGSSAPYTVGLLQKLLMFEPITPLTGADDEWIEVSEFGDGTPRWQNTRCGRVFKDATGAYDIDGKVFREPDGCCFTSRDSRVPVNFPYWPKTEYVDVPAPENETS